MSLGTDNSAFDVRLRRIYVYRTGRLPPPDFGKTSDEKPKKKVRLLPLLLVPLFCGTGGLVGASALSGDLVPALRLATGSAISLDAALNMLEICGDTLGKIGLAGFHSDVDHMTMENAGHSVPDMTPSPFP